MLRNFAADLFGSRGSPEVRRARYKAMAGQIPLMNCMIIVNTLTLAYTHYGFLSWQMSLGVPLALILFTAYRSILILRTDVDALNDTVIASRLRTIVILSLTVSILISLWAYYLFSQGNFYTQLHVAFYMCMTAIGSVTCIMHIRQASLLISILVIGSGMVFLGASDITVFRAIAVNMLVVTAVILITGFGYARDFTNLVERGRILRAQGRRLRELNAENMQLANIDSLTGLPNRRSFFTELNALVEERVTTDVPFVVGILDLDGFKPVNDIFGHTAGDELLAKTGKRLRQLLPDDVVLARLGGDEFGIVIPAPGSKDSVRVLGKRLCTILRVPCDVKDGTARVSATIGFAMFPTAGRTAEALFERADYALCYAKQNNKGSTVLFSDKHEHSIRRISEVVHHMREASLADELSVMFQPIVDTKSGATVAFEALGRWHSPVLGPVPPDVFIRSAEQEGLIGRVTSILFRKALAVASEWPEHVHLSFNLSVHDLCSMISVQRLVSDISKSGIAFNRITFEITETGIMQDFERAREALALLRSMGIKIALDDFGTGFSSLSYVQKLPVDRLKIDRSFIGGIEEDETARNILRTIVALCEYLGLDCVVEGVETASQLAIIEEIGCKLIQGYLFSKPMGAEDAKAFLGSGSAGESAGAA